MKKSQQGISVMMIIGFTVLLSGSQLMAADYTGKSTVTTDPTKATYYNNNLQENGAITNSATKAYATDPKNREAVQAIIGANGGQCGIQCAKALDTAAQALKPLDAKIIDPNTNTVTTVQAGTTPEEGKTATDPTKKTPAKSTANTSTATDNILGIEEGKLRNGDVDMNTIPLVIVNVISTLLAIAGTVAIFSLIYHAVQMQINSGITGDSSGVDKAKKGMIGALVGFVIAISAWFLVTQAVSLLATATN